MGVGAGNSLIDVTEGTSSLVVDATLTDMFSGEMRIGADNTVTMNNAWQLDGELNFEGSPPDMALLTGAKLDVETGGSVNVTTGEGRISGALDLSSGGSVNLAVDTKLGVYGVTTFEAGSTIDVAAGGILDIAGNTSWAGPTTVAGAGTIRQDYGDVVADTTIDVDTFDLDGVIQFAATTTIHPGATLTVNSPNIDINDNVFDGTLNIYAGTLDMAGPASWQATGTIAFDNTGGQATLDGSPLAMMGPSSQFVSHLGKADVLADVSFSADTDVRIAGLGAGWRFWGDVTYNGTTVSEDAAGIIHHNGNVTVAAGATTTVNVTTFDWDGPGLISNTTDVESGASLVLNVDQIDLDDDVFDGTVNLHGGDLTVNNTADAWTLNGAMNFTSGISNVDGAALTVNGNINVSAGAIGDLHTPVAFESTAAVTSRLAVNWPYSTRPRSRAAAIPAQASWSPGITFSRPTPRLTSASSTGTAI